MKFKEVIALLKRWFEKLSLVMFLRGDEFDTSKRALLFGAAALVASSALASVPGYRTQAQLTGYVPMEGSLSAELSAVVRRAFMPRVYVQLWRSAPLMSKLLAELA